MSLPILASLPTLDAVAVPGDRNPYRAYVATLGPGSRRSLASCLHRIAALFLNAHGHAPETVPADSFPWYALRAEHTALIRALVEQQHTRDSYGRARPWSPAYRNKHLSALRGVLGSAWRLGLISTDDHLRARAFANFPGSRLPTGRNINPGELAAMLHACAEDRTAAGRRDAAMLAILYSTGARRAEVATLCREEYDPGGRSLRIVGKGDKERLEYLHPEAAALLAEWLALEDATRGPLLKPVHRSGAIQQRHLSGAAIRNAVLKRRRAASLPPLTPHDFRRTFIGDLLDAGVDLATAQQLVGHASPTTTARYDRRPDRRRRSAVDLLPFPVPA